MFITIAIAWLWITIVMLGVGAAYLIWTFSVRVLLAFIMASQWRREDLAHQDDYPRDIR
jgi:hypothetical protein